MRFVHICARADHPHTPFADRTACVWIWRLLKHAFPQSVACVLMPNHFHLITTVSDLMSARRTVGRILGSFSQWKKPVSWAPIYISPIPDLHHLRRQVRYALLNPARKKPLGIQDPLEWEWSTHRDWVGAVLRPWQDPKNVIKALRFENAPELHRYITSDRDVSIHGTSSPAEVSASQHPSHSLHSILNAAVLASRSEYTDLFKRGSSARHLAVQLAYRQGWRGSEGICQALRISREAWRKLKNRPLPENLLKRASLNLGDPRLLPPRLTLHPLEPSATRSLHPQG